MCGTGTALPNCVAKNKSSVIYNNGRIGVCFAFRFTHISKGHTDHGCPYFFVGSIDG